MENLRFSVWKLHLSLRSAKPHQLYCRRHHSSSSQPHRTTTTLTNLIKIAVVSLLLINCQCESRTTVQNSEQSSNSFVNSKTEIRDPNFIKSKLNTTGNGLISRALQEERLEDAVRLFLEEWETLHGIRASNKTTARTKVKVRDQDTEMQADHPIVSPPTWASNGTSVDRNTLIAAAIQRSREMISDSDTLPTEDDEEDETDSNHHELQQTPQQRNCSRCMMQEEARQRRLQEIKVDILNKLGLKHVPNVTTKSLPEIPPLYHLREKFGILNDNPRLSTSSGLTSGAREEDEMSSDQPAFVYSGSIPPNDREEEFEEFYVNTERAISLAQKPPETWKIPKEFRAQYFKLTAKVVNSHVNKAHLWAHITPSERNYFEPNKNIVLAWVVVYQIVKGKEGDSPTLMEVKKKKFEVEKEGGWVQIDVKKLVTHWSRKPNENRGLVMHCYDSQGHELTITGPENGMDQTKRTFIEIQVETKSQNRKRRLIGLNCDQNSKEVRCCRNPLTVDFEEFGWDWIIAPKRYEANYCSGECPFVFLQKYPHTHLVQQANPSGSTGPCCAPRKMSSISMLYFDDNYNIIHGMLPGMVVDRCSCS